MPGQMMGSCQSGTVLGKAGDLSPVGCLGCQSPWRALRVGMGQTHTPRSVGGLERAAPHAPQGSRISCPGRLLAAPGHEGSQLCSGSLHSTWLRYL